jgi:membrane-bound transcription factor site-1 protease
MEMMNIVKVVDFTGSSSLIDYNGHGTFVTGILSGTNEECPGIAPDAEIYILKLFTDDNVTYSSWFIDAFNFVLDNNIDIVNLSTATKDSQDIPFMDKI